MDIFFVLSGFIISYTSLKSIGHREKLPSFLRRRFVRIYPTYWIIISLLLLSQVLLPVFFNTPYSFTAKNLLGTYFLFPGHTMVNGVSWTLSYELFFYFLFCFAFVIPRKKIAFCLGMLYSLVIILLPLFGYDYKDADPWIDLITFPMNVEFFMGVTAAAIVSHVPKKLSLVLIISGAVLFIMSGIFSNLGYQAVTNNFNRVILFGIPSFLIITGVVKYELVNKITVPKWLLNIGEASYSLYLLHLPIVVAAFRMLGKLNLKNAVLLHLLMLSVLCIIVYVAVIFYKVVEKPIINRLNAMRRIKVANEI